MTLTPEAEERHPAAMVRSPSTRIVAFGGRVREEVVREEVEAT